MYTLKCDTNFSFLSMAINKRNKGYRIETLAKKKLEAFGYLVEKQNYSRFHSQDFYGLFDLIAIKKSTVRFIQIKSVRSHAYQAIRDIQKWLIENKLTTNAEVWTYMGNNKWIIEYVYKDHIESFPVEENAL